MGITLLETVVQCGSKVEGYVVGLPSNADLRLRFTGRESVNRLTVYHAPDFWQARTDPLEHTVRHCNRCFPTSAYSGREMGPPAQHNCGWF